MATTAPQKLPAASKSTAPTKTLAQAKAEAAAVKAAQDKAIAQQVAAATAAKAKQQAEIAAAKKTSDAKAALEKDILAKISTANSSSVLKDFLAQAKSAGITVPSSAVTAANNNIQKTTADSEANRVAAAERTAADAAAAKAVADAKAAADAKILADARAAAAARSVEDAKTAAAAISAAKAKAEADAAAKVAAAAKIKADAESATQAKAAQAAAQTQARLDQAAADRAASEKAIADRAAVIEQQAQARKDKEAAAAKAAAETKAAIEAERQAAREKAAEKVAAAEKASAETKAAIEAERQVAREKAAEKTAAAEKAAADTKAAIEAERQTQRDAAAAKEAAVAKAAADAEIASQAKIEARNVKNLSEDPRYQSAVKQLTESGQPVTQAAILSQYQSQQTAARDAQVKARADAAVAKTAETKAATDKFIADLPPPGSEKFGITVANGYSINAPDGSEIRATPQNLATGEPGGYFITRDGGNTYQDLAGKGPVVPAGEFEQQLRGQSQSNIALQTQQAQEAQAAQQQARKDAQEAAVKNAAAQQEYAFKAQNADTPEQAQAIIDQAKAAGQWNLNDQVTNSYITGAQKRVDAAAKLSQEFDTTKKADTGSFAKLSFDSKVDVKSLDPSIMNVYGGDINKITDNGKNPLQMSDPKAPGYLTPSQLSYYLQAGDKNAAGRQKAYDYASKLLPPTANQNKFTPEGYELVGLVDNPYTEQNEQGWYTTTGTGIQKIGEDGSLTGPVIPDFDAYNTLRQEVERGAAAYKQEQSAKEAALAASTLAANVKDFETALPTPDQFAATGRPGLRGPDGNEYSLLPANQATGAGRQWVKTASDMSRSTILATGEQMSVEQLNKNFGNIQAVNNQVAQQQRIDQIRQQAEDRAGLGMDDFLKVLAVMAIGSVVMGVIGGAGAAGQAALAGSTAGEAAAAAAGMAESGLTATEIAAALEAEGIGAAAAQAAAETATGLASGTIDAATIVAESGLTPEAFTAAAESANPLAAINETITTVTGSGSAAPLAELSAAETAQVMSGIDPNMISSFAPGTAGTAGGTAGSIFSGTSINPITNALVNAGITNPIAVGALTGAGTSAAMNLVTGQPITGKSLLTGALGGGVAGGIGSVMPDFGGGALGGAIGGAATNLGATAVVSLVTGQPITAGSLAGAALIGGAIGGAVGAYTDGAGNTTYQYDDGSSMTVSRTGTPVSVTDNTGSNVPVGAVDRLTGEPKPLAPVEDRVPTPVAPGAPPAGTIPVQAADGTILYTDGQTYYTADGTVTDITNPTPGGATQEALLSPGSQQIVNDAGKDFAAGTKTWEETTARVNQAVRDDINSGYLKPTGDGTYIAPDGTEYFFNAESGMYDARVGTPGGTGYQGGTVTDPAQPPVLAAPTDQITTLPVDGGTVVAPPVDTITQPVDRPIVPVDTPVTEPVTPPPVDPTTPYVPPIIDPVVAPPVTDPVVTAPVVPTTPITDPVAPPPGTEPVVLPPGTGGTGTDPGTGGPGTGGPGTEPGTGGPGLTPGPGPVAPPVDPIPPPGVVTPPDVVAPPPDVVAPPVDPTPPPVDPTPPPVDPTPPPLEPLPPGEPVPPPVPPGPDITPPDVTPPVVEPPYVPPTYPPIYVPPIEPPVVPPVRKVYDPLDPTRFGAYTPLVNPGLNPGYITNVPRSYAPSGVRSQFYYGQRPFQPGPTFNRSLYNQTPAAPAQPWGLQQMYNPQTETIQNLLKGVQQAATRAPYNIPRAPKV